MPPLIRALLWASASLAIALAWIADAIPGTVGSILVLVLPIIMLATTPRAACRKG
ncbi:hypothetical protein [Sphingopyxis solisilvae]|uniref:hypothetical protein n=1 Tax=Sphingopyxis solisilvae TaxID=1886788 RepID=UPI001892A86A|nr:hypothetical protein [Sphingopyxis solisilvae]